MRSCLLSASVHLQVIADGFFPFPGEISFSAFIRNTLSNGLFLTMVKKSIQDIIPRDDRIQYHFIGGEGKTRLPMGEKRNRLVELASHDIVVFMDDDDYYPPESVTARVKSLLHENGIKGKQSTTKKIQCVGCSDYLIYDIVSDKWGEASQGQEYLSEAFHDLLQILLEREVFSALRSGR